MAYIYIIIYESCAQSDQIYSHNFCYQERTVNIDVYVSVADTGSFSVAIILTYYHMLQYDL